MLKTSRVFAIQVGVLVAYFVIAFFSDWIPPTISAILAVLWFVAFLVVMGGLNMASAIHEDTSDRSLSELIREARDQDSPPR